jgi:hypothetical protein
MSLYAPKGDVKPAKQRCASHIVESVYIERAQYNPMRYLNKK